MSKYPIGIQDFQKLRSGGYLYVDKTKQLLDLTVSGNYLFLARPRRFGKSLLMSTLAYLFRGRRDLFEGLWVDREANYDWKAHPVLHFSFSSSGYKDIGLEPALERLIEQGAGEHGVELKAKGLSGRFRELLQTLGSGPQKVVLLIDEYDKPITDYLDNLPQANAHREILKNFFSVIKDADPYLRFFLITGVSKFSKVSLFSDLNHLNDITRHPRYATLTGYTPGELDHYFSDDYPALAEANGLSLQEVKEQMQLWYNGYQFEPGFPVYNPFSILRLFDAGRFRNFWWDSGTPTLLLKSLKKAFQFDLHNLRVGPSMFDSYTLEDLDWRNLLFQTGYITIKSHDRETDIYTLGYPNFEVEASMTEYLLGTFRHASHIDTQVLYTDMRLAFDSGDLPLLIERVDQLFSTIPYQIFDKRREGFFHAVLHLTFQGLGLMTESEVSRAKGRIDCVVRSKSGVYVLEFKLDDSAEAALAQIREKRYGSAWLGGGLPVVAVGINFSSRTRTVEDWKAVDYRELLGEG